MNLATLFWRVWSKSDRTSPERWHGLPWHLLAVGLMAMEMWQTTVPTWRRRRLAESLGVDEVTLGRWLGFLAAVHDLGKLSAAFQGLVAEQKARLVFEFGDELPFPWKPDHLPHGTISIYVLTDLFQRKLGMELVVASRYAMVTGAHHGLFPDARILRALEGYRREIGDGMWADAREDLFDWLLLAFELPNPLPVALRTTLLPYPDALWLAGLISVADWLGSDEKFFAYRQRSATPNAAVKHLRSRVQKALAKTGWRTPRLKIAAGEFTDAIRTLPPGANPYPAQQIAVEAIRGMCSPGIAIVEYPTGDGKTEIAMWAAAHWAERFGVDGFYFAMPTMATSDQLHDRVSKHFSTHLDGRTDQVNLQLLHGQAALSVRPEITMDGPERELADQGLRLAAQRSPDEPRKNLIQRMIWFTRRKRGQLALYGVGTIDQALMSILRMKHFFVRLHGFGGKTVIFDEVHGYDVYMSTLFDELLRWMGALGSPVVILSATLPTHRTRAMLAAYAAGAGWNPAVGEPAVYPRISVCDEHSTRSFSARNPDDPPDRILRVQLMPSLVADDHALWQRVGDELDVILRDGGVAAVICNTVRQAQQTYEVLARWFSPEADQLTLFHARFRQKDRAGIQKHVLQRFGKDAGSKRPRRHVVVATQVIEQSLDLDFDLLVSMFCPTDLLIQRIGRMQRHRSLDAVRPRRFRADPAVWLIGFDVHEGLPEFAAGSQRIYSRHVLIRSWAALRSQTTIAIPNDVAPLIEATYAPDSAPPRDLERLWNESYDAFEQHRRDHERSANRVRIPSLDDDHPEEGDNPLEQVNAELKDQDDDEPHLHPSALARTRLGPPSVNLIMLRPDEANDLVSILQQKREEPLTLTEIRKLLAHAVGLNDRRVVRAHREMRAPRLWEDSAFLRHHRLVIVDEAGNGLAGDVRVTLEPKLGVCVEREEVEGAVEP